MRCAIEQFTLFGEDEPAGMAVKQLDADILLKRRYLPADRGLGEVQLVGGMGKRACFRCSMEYPQLVPVQRHARTFHCPYSAAASVPVFCPVM